MRALARAARYRRVTAGGVSSEVTFAASRTPPVTYRVRGPKAPRGVRGVVEFERGRLTQLSFTGGVRTTLGVTVGRTTPARMVERFRRAGYQASLRYVGTFQGTFVTVERGGKQVLGGFAQGGRITTLGVPGVPVCE